MFDVGHGAKVLPNDALEQLAALRAVHDAEIPPRPNVLPDDVDRVVAGAHGDRTSRDEVALEAWKQRFERVLSGAQQDVHVRAVRNAGAMARGARLGVALEYGDALEELAQHSRGDHAGDAAADDDCVTTVSSHLELPRRNGVRLCLRQSSRASRDEADRRRV